MPRLSKIGAAALAAFGWTGLSSVTASYLVVAGGGGGGGQYYAGGGGAGGLLTGTTSLNPTLSYTVTVGAGGNAGSTNTGSSGSNSVFNLITSTGGGGGGGGQTTTSINGLTGGSGGGGGVYSPALAGTGAAGTSGQGNAGGAGNVGSGGNVQAAGGGGGGANATTGTGTAGAVAVGGTGGNGTASSISGSSVTYAGGGGGGVESGTAGTGGSGGGGNGQVGGGTAPTAGTANRGGGGGGSGYGTSGGQGGSGVVIISYVGAQQFGGGVVTSSGGSTIHTFNTSGTLSPLSSLTASYLIVAGGGAGAFNRGAGGGGAGGLLTSSGLTIDTNSIYAVTVGAGGAGSSTGAATSGSNSSFSMVSTVAVGGGVGGSNSQSSSPYNGTSGGSGGGAGGANTGGGTGGAATSGQGNAGGDVSGSATNNNAESGGGGGGAGGAGSNATVAQTGANGGAGLSASAALGGGTYAGGGGGAANGASSVAGSGGSGGGGNGKAASTGNGDANSGTANTGGGGGGHPGPQTPSITGSSGNGGSGVVIISYAGSTQQMAGGTVTVAGGNVIHTFTSSGYLTPIVLVTNSLRFRSSASAYLNRTPASAGTGTGKTWTWSGWVKRGTIGSSGLISLMYGATSAGASDRGGFGFYTYSGGGTGSDSLTLYYDANFANNLTTTQVFRDPAAWYHIIYAVDTTQATASNRVKLYVNGVQVTAFSASNYPTQNYQFAIGNNVAQWISSEAGTQRFFDGYMTDINFIDGQQLTPFSFGTTSDLGVWQPIRYGGSYGTNGFYLPFTASTSSTYAGSFNASNQSLSTPNASQFSLGSSDFTVEAWVYLTNSSVATSNNVLNQSDGGAGSNSAFFFGVGSNGVALYLSTTGTSWTNFINGGSVIPQQNRWYHIVWQRSGNTIQTFVNGVLSSSSAFSGTVNTSTRNIEIGCQDNAGSFFGGYISNVRLVKGVAVYTNGFTPPTANLSATQSAGVNISAITGAQTSYLTLQNSSIVDNSTFAVTITNNNGVATSVQYPFVTQAFNDQGSAGNNWTPNNIGGLFGSSYDFMTDVPTLTSATTANYATLNPLDSYSTAISNGNLKFSDGSGNAYQAYSTMSNPDIATYKFYCEVTVEIAYLVGIVPETKSAANGSTDRTSVLGYYSNGNKYNGTSASAYGATFTTGDIIGIAFGNGQVEFYKNNVSQGVAFSSLTGGYKVATWAAGSAGIGCSFNFGQRPFAYTPPTGFIALNTFNLPTPTIGATASTTANKYFDVTLYTGNGAPSSNTTQNIATAFYPDLTWVKGTNTGFYYRLTSTGLTQPNYLSTNSTDPEGSLNDQISALASTYFQVKAAGTGGTNQSNTPYVGWTWNANSGSTVSNTAGTITSTVSANTTAGFSIVTYTGTGGTGTTTVGHGLGVAPSMVIIKRRNGTTDWASYHTGLTSTSYYLVLNSLVGQANYGSTFISPSSSTLTIAADSSLLNTSTGTYVAYCFAPVAGYSAFGRYTGNNDTNGPFVYLGFRPHWVMVKSLVESSNWLVYDTARSTYNQMDILLLPSDPQGNYTDSTYAIDAVSNGFKIRGLGQFGGLNNSGNGYIYMAFAENPFKYANAR